MKKLLVLIALIAILATYLIFPWNFFAPFSEKQVSHTMPSKDTLTMPYHLAIVMDGNRRWAKKNGLLAWQGHNEGVKSLERTVDFCLDNGIKILTCYVFSLENFKRSQEEKDHLFNLLIEQSNKFFNTLAEKQVKIKFVGNPNLFPDVVRPTINSIEQATQKYDKLLVNMLFCYGGRQEILAAVKTIAQEYKEGMLDLATMTLESVKKYVWLGDIPDPDLIIRTGGDQRLSNFLLYQSAYSELYFTNTLWPDFDDNELIRAIQYYTTCRRSSIGQ